MAKITFSKLNLKLNKEVVNVPLTDEITLEVRKYLPQTEKADLISFVMDYSIDETTMCFSPIRLETYFSLAIAKYYGNITFTDKQIEDAAKTYDILESNGVIDKIISAIPRDEFEFIQSAVNDTAEDISRYYNSFAGMLSTVTKNTGSIDSQFTELFEKIKNKEGLEELAAIRDIVG